jgi:hypothetical protein
MDNTLLLTVKRFSDTGKETLSSISLTEHGATLFDCVGVELPWKDNESRISCIPVGEYDCVKVPATAAIPYEHISIANVPNRSGVCIHTANFVSQLLGCIAVGDKHVDINGYGLLDITNSKATYNVLMRLLPNAFKLSIVNQQNQA